MRNHRARLDWRLTQTEGKGASRAAAHADLGTSSQALVQLKVAPGKGDSLATLSTSLLLGIFADVSSV